MPSLWSWLCFPNHGNRRQRKRNSTKLNKNQSFSSGYSTSGQKRRYGNLHSADHVGAIYQVDQNTDYPRTHDRLEEKNSTKPLVNQMDTKRRRVQEIFNQPCEDSSIPNYSYKLPVEKDHRPKNSGNFGSEYTPRFYQYHAEPSPTDSMYDYVPKAVQNVYASTALEGRKIDDFFNDLHFQNSLTKFGNADQMKRNQSVVSKTKFPFARQSSLGSMTQIDKVSLLDPDANGNETETTNQNMDWNGNGIDLSARFESILNASFDSAWNSKEEVLY